MSSAKCPYNHNIIPEGYYKHLPLAKARTTPPSRRRAQAVPNRYHRRERIGQRDHPGPGLRLPRPVLEGTVRGQRLGATGVTGGAPDGPEHAPTTPKGVPHNRFTSVMSMVCYIAPTANTPPVFGTVLLFFQQSVRPYVAIILTQMVDIQVM